MRRLAGAGRNGPTRNGTRMELLDVYTLARQGGVREGCLAVAQLPRLAAGLLRSEGTLRFRALGLHDALARPALRLRVEGSVPLRCDRCGGELQLALAGEREFFFVQTQRELASLPVDDAPEEPLLGSTHFDLAGLVEDEAILMLPLSPRHPDCGAALAAPAAADAPGEPERPHPFAGLAGLRDALRPAARNTPAGRVAAGGGGNGAKDGAKDGTPDGTPDGTQNGAGAGAKAGVGRRRRFV